MNKVKKRILSLITSAAIAVTSIGVMPRLAEMLPEAGSIFRSFVVPAGADDTTDDTVYTSVAKWSTLQAALSAGKNVKLSMDIKAGSTDTYLEVPAGESVIIDLNGFTIDRGLTEMASDGYVIKVSGDLTVKDSHGGGKITGGYNTAGGGGVYVDQNARFTLTGGKISGNTANNNNNETSATAADNGGGVYVNGGTFTMTDGSISDNLSSGHGGGVYVKGGTFTMTGGTISGNTVIYSGGGVYIYSGCTFTMTGGTISGNTAIYAGGGVYNEGTFLMTNGAISENTVSNGAGGGVYAEKSTCTMYGGEICRNTANGSGGGVLIKSTCTFTMYAGSISENMSSTAGGGVNNSATFIMYSGSICKNKAATTSANTNTRGGGMFNSGTFTLYGGSITECEATLGGGVYNSVTFNMYGGSITECEAEEGGGVYTNKSFTMNGGAITGGEAKNGGGVYVFSETFTLTKGLISGNTATNGGGVYVSSSGKFNMDGGDISGNTARYDDASSGRGGGVYVYCGKFNMTGGSITENKAVGSASVVKTGLGGGVYFYKYDSYGSFTVSGKPIIYENTAVIGDVSKKNNAYLAVGSTITVDSAKMQPGAVISATVESGTTIATGASAGDIACFFCDDKDYIQTFDSVNNNIVATNTVINNFTGKILTWTGLSFAGRDGGSYKLANNITGSTAVAVSFGKTLILDLAGYSITFDPSSAELQLFNVSGNLVIMDTVGGGEIICNNTTVDNCVYINNSGNFTMLGGNISNAGNSGVVLSGIYTSSFTMLGGSVTAETYGICFSSGDTVNIACSPVINSNIEIADKKINVIGKLSSAAKIAIATNGYTKVFAEGSLYEGDEARFKLSDGTVTISNGKAYASTSAAAASDWSLLQEQFSKSGSVKLTRDVTAVEGQGALTVPAGTTVVLDLNGYKIDRGLYNSEMTEAQAATAAKENGYVIDVKGTLIVKDTSTGGLGKITGGNSNGNGGGVNVNTGSSLILLGGSISGNYTNSDGGGVYNAGTFNMYGGEISHNSLNSNSSAYGGGVQIKSGSFNLNGGIIKNNTAYLGGGVFVGGGTLTMSGGSITENSADHYGGGVYANRNTFTMTGGTITGNSAAMGGGVYVAEVGTFNIAGTPVVKGNTGRDVVLSNNNIAVTGKLGRKALLSVTKLDDNHNVTDGVFATGLTGGKGTADNFDSPEGYSVVIEGDDAKFGHKHNFTGTVSGQAITVSCDVTGCTLNTTPATVTISVPAGGAIDPEDNKYKITCDGEAKPATLSGYDEAVFGKAKIVYKKDGTVITDEPVYAGTYTASITLGGATASVEYTITKGTAVTPQVIPDGLAAHYGDTLSKVTLPKGWSWKDTATVVTVAKEYPAYYNPSTSSFTDFKGAVPVGVIKGDYGDKTMSASVTYGTTGSIDLSQYVVSDGSVGLPDGNVTDTDGILDRTDGYPKVESTTRKLNVKMINDKTKAGKTATIKVKVESSIYEDYYITVTVTLNGITYTHHPYSAPGCTYGGNLDYYTDQYNNYYTKKGDTYTKTTASAVILSAYGHDYMWTTTKEPTCTEPGEKTCVCLNCGDTDTVTIKALGHKKSAPVEEITVEPTCTEDGSGFDVVKCENCGEEISRTEKVIKALGHKPTAAVEEVTVPATCTEDGSGFDVVKCERCQEEISRTEKVFPALGHDLETVRLNEKEPDCITDGGYDEVTRCKRCQQETSRKSVVVPKLGHTFENGVCTRCGAIEVKPGNLTNELDKLSGEKVTVSLDDDETMPKITFPKDVGELTIDGGGHTLTFTGGGITMKPFGKLILVNVTIQAMKNGKPQNITLTAAAGGLVLENVKFEGKKTTINAKKGDLTLGDITAADLYINGNAKTNLTVDGAVNATKIMNFGKLLLGSTLTASKTLNIGAITFAEGSILNAATGAAITFKNGLSGNGTINLADGFKPLTLKGSVSGKIVLTADKPFAEGKQIFKSALTNLNDVFNVLGIAPVVNDGTYEYGLYVKSNKAYLRAFKMKLGDTTFCEISDLMSGISGAKDSSKAYEMNILGDTQTGAFNLPKKGTYKGLTINGSGHTMTLKGNTLTLTGDLTLTDVTIASAKGAWVIKTNGFTLTADTEKLINCTVK